MRYLERLQDLLDCVSEDQAKAIGGTILVLFFLGGCATFSVPAGEGIGCKSKALDLNITLNYKGSDESELETLAFTEGEKNAIRSSLENLDCFTSIGFNNSEANLQVKISEVIVGGRGRQFWSAISLFSLGIVPYWGEIRTTAKITLAKKAGYNKKTVTYTDSSTRVLSVLVVPVSIWRLATKFENTSEVETDRIKSIIYFLEQFVKDLNLKPPVK